MTPLRTLDIPSPSRACPLAAAILAAALLVAAGIGGCKPWNSSAPVCLAGAKLNADDACRSQRAPLHRIPFRPGYETKVMQAYHGYRTHKKDLAYSVDYRCESGTPVTASRNGVVWAIREDSNRGCNDPSCVDDGNYVVLDHGDGTFSEYHHLQQFGALVDVGDSVCRGEAVGLCGNTGYTSGPHLHFALTDVSHRTIPSRVPTSRDRRFPFVVPETTYVSENRRNSPCKSTSYSRIPRDAFTHQGVLLDRKLPLVVERKKTSSRLSGTYYGDHPQIAVHRKLAGDGDWIDECVEVDADGGFQATLQWPDSEIDPGFYWFMITGADEECQSPGWAWSYKVRVD